MRTMSHKSAGRRAAARAGDLGLALFGLPSRMVELACRWSDRANMRKHLEEMDDRMLRDVGIDRATARREAHKPFWRS